MSFNKNTFQQHQNEFITIFWNLNTKKNNKDNEFVKSDNLQVQGFQMSYMSRRMAASACPQRRKYTHDTSRQSQTKGRHINEISPFTLSFIQLFF